MNHAKTAVSCFPCNKTIGARKNQVFESFANHWGFWRIVVAVQEGFRFHSWASKTQKPWQALVTLTHQSWNTKWMRRYAMLQCTLAKQSCSQVGISNSDCSMTDICSPHPRYRILSPGAHQIPCHCCPRPPSRLAVMGHGALVQHDGNLMNVIIMTQDFQG